MTWARADPDKCCFTKEITVSRSAKKMTAVLLGFAALAAWALPAQARMLGDFQAADTNRDGKVSLQEYQAYATKQMAGRNGRLAQRFKALSPQDQQVRLKQRFDAADANHDGSLDQKEWGG